MRLVEVPVMAFTWQFYCCALQRICHHGDVIEIVADFGQQACNRALSIVEREVVKYFKFGISSRVTEGRIFRLVVGK